MALTGIYRHFKGNYYEVVGIAVVQGTNDELVLYRQLYDVFGYWMRPKAMFFGDRLTEKGPIKRFECVGKMFQNSLDKEDIGNLTIGHSESQKMYKVLHFTKTEEGYLITVQALE